MGRYLKQVGAGLLAGLVLSNVAYVALSVGVAFLLSAMIDAAANTIAEGTMEPLMRTLVLSLAYVSVEGVALVVALAVAAHAKCRVMLAVRGRAVEGLLAPGADAAGAASQNSADSLTLLGQGMATLETSGVDMAVEMLRSCLQIAFSCAALLLINPLVGLLSLAVSAIPAVVPALFGPRLSALQEAILERGASYTARVRDLAQGSEVVRSFGLGAVQGRLHAEAAESLEGTKAQLGVTMGWMSGLSSIVGISVQITIMALTGWFAMQGLVTVGSIVAVVQLSGQVISPAFELSQKLGKLRSVRPVLDQVDALAAGASRTVGEASAELPLHHALSLDDVAFSYGEGAPSLEHLSATFAAGEKYALVGPSGSGKSTVLRLLAGRLAPTAGTVLVDGVAGVPEAAFIHQQVFLFDDTLRNNITLWGSFSEDSVARAVRAAGLDELVASLPEGLDTPVEENGGRFSGGERQRVAIARALLHQKSVLFVDEATSALDNEIAARVEDALLSLDGVTVVAVTHRLDAAHARRYDGVLELRDGRLAPLGPRLATEATAAGAR